MDLTLAVRPSEGFHLQNPISHAQRVGAWSVSGLSMVVTGAFRTEYLRRSRCQLLEPRESSQHCRMTRSRLLRLYRPRSAGGWRTALSPRRENSQPMMMPRRAKMRMANPGLQVAVIRQSRTSQRRRLDLIPERFFVIHHERKIAQDGARCRVENESFSICPGRRGNPSDLGDSRNVSGQCILQLHRHFRCAMCWPVELELNHFGG